MNFLSRADFQDSKSHKACSGKRVCVECAIVHELYDNTSFVWGGINKFWCFGCHVIQPVLNDEGIPNEGFYVYERAQALRNAQRTGTRPVHVDTQEHKWCRPCWETIKMFEIAQRNLAGKVRARREKRRDARREKRRALAALAAANAAAVVAAVATSVQ